MSHRQVVNIFVLSECPVEAARWACDRHSVKMILEGCQMLSTALRFHGYEGDDVYRSSHVNHPSSVWCRTNGANFSWLLTHTYALCQEYRFRYGKTHKSTQVLQRCAELASEYLPLGRLTPPPKCMPSAFQVEGDDWLSVVESYRNYYRFGKTYMNRGSGPQWRKIPSRQPRWFQTA